MTKDGQLTTEGRGKTQIFFRQGEVQIGETLVFPEGLLLNDPNIPVELVYNVAYAKQKGINLSPWDCEPELLFNP